jgi:hypothetical protein
MIDGFGVIPHGLDRPLAVFDGLSEAIEWGHREIGEHGYRVRYVRAVMLPPDRAVPVVASPTGTPARDQR